MGRQHPRAHVQRRDTVKACPLPVEADLVSGHLVLPHAPTLSPGAGGASTGFKRTSVPPPGLGAPTGRPGHPPAHTRLLGSKSRCPQGLTGLAEPWGRSLAAEGKMGGCQELTVPPHPRSSGVTQGTFQAQRCSPTQQGQHTVTQAGSSWASQSRLVPTVLTAVGAAEQTRAPH